MALPSPPPTSRREFWLLLASVVGLFALADVARRVTPDPAPALDFTDSRLLATIAIEAVLALLWLPYLKRRGWSVEHVTQPLLVTDIARALGLAIAAYVAYVLTFALVAIVEPSLALAVLRKRASGVPSLGIVLAVSLLNPVFEEFLYLGYVANALRSRGLARILATVVALRVLLHLYQGALAFLAILPVALVFSMYYLRTGRLWPVIGAHAMMDAFSLTLLSRLGSPS